MGLNDFIITADDFTVPASADPNRCRVFGFFVDISGVPLRSSQIHFINRFLPQILSDPAADKAVLGGRAIIKTDENGFMQVDLIRNSQLDVMVPSQNFNPHIADTTEAVFEVTIPDVASINIADLLYPAPISVNFLTVDPVTVAVDVTLEVPVDAFLTDGSKADALARVVQFTSSDVDLVTVGIALDKITMRRIAAGTVNITVAIHPDVLIIHQPPTVLTLRSLDGGGDPTVLIPNGLQVD